MYRNCVEHIAANGEIAHYEQFLLLPQCVQKSIANTSNPSLWGKVFNSVRNPYQSDYLSIDLPVNQVIIAPIHSTNDLFYNDTLTATKRVLQNKRRFRQIKSEN